MFGSTKPMPLSSSTQLTAEAFRIAEIYAIESSKGRTAAARRYLAAPAPVRLLLKPWTRWSLALFHLTAVAAAIRCAARGSLTRFHEDGRIEIDNNTVEPAPPVWRTERGIASGYVGSRWSLQAKSRSASRIPAQ
jgi:hypothetical protein